MTGLPRKRGTLSAINTTEAPMKQRMTPRERAVEALEGRRPPGRVPSCELAFALHSEWLGRPANWPHVPEDAGATERDRILRAYVRDAIEVFREMDHCIISEWSGNPYLFEAYRAESGDEFLLGFPSDPTYGIPDGAGVEEFIFRISDDPQGLHDEASRRVDDALAHVARMQSAGGDVIWMGSDYAMNGGPFLSPAMFAEFVAPYLHRVIQGYRALGLYVIKHSDGDINPLMDMIVEAGPHAIHSIDVVAGMDIKTLKEKFGDRVALIGNVPHGPLQMNQFAEIESAARYCLEHGGVVQGGYIYSTSNAVFGDVGNGIDVNTYRFMLDVRDRYMEEVSPQLEGGSKCAD